MIRASAIALALIATPLAAQASDLSGRFTLAQAASVSAIDLQRALARAGYYDGAIDGVIGPGTRAAVAAYQRDHGLSATGSATTATLNRLQAQGFLSAQAGTGARDDTGTQRSDLVSDMQAALRQRGYDVDAVTGYLDADTRSAIRSFQRQQGLPATGRPSAELLALLESGTGTTADTTADTAPATQRLSQDELVRQIEQRLANKGYDVGPVDTTLEAKSQEAIRTYQRQRGLEQTGAASAELLADIERSGVTAQQAQTPGTPEEAIGNIIRGLGDRAADEVGR